MSDRTFILGLDACTWKLLERGIEKDALPTIERHIRDGYSATMESTIPAATCPAWKTMTTGKNPGRLNVFTTRVGTWGGEKRAALQSDFRSADYWDYLNQYANKRTAILNLPNTYPTRELDGVMVAGRGIPKESKLFVYPESESERLDEIGYQPFEVFARALRNQPEQTYNQVLDYVDAQFRTAESYLENHDIVQLCTLVTDTYQHEYLHTGKALELYSYIDDKLDDLEKSFDDLNIVIVSDHGMTEGPDKVIWINRWLKEKGWLVTVDESDGSEDTISSPSSVHIRSIYNQLPFKIQRTIEKTLDRLGIRDRISEAVAKPSNHYNIDWAATDAAYFTGGIRIQDNDADLAMRICNEFEKDFGQYYPDNIEPLLHRSDIYKGDYADSKYAPDLMRNQYLKRHVRIRTKQSNQLVTDHDPAEIHRHEHDPLGVFIADGPLFGSSSSREEIQIYDVMTTIIGAFGYRIDGELDGQIRENAISNRGYETVPELPDPYADSESDDSISEEYTEEIEDQLEDLGYLQ